MPKPNDLHEADELHFDQSDDEMIRGAFKHLEAHEAEAFCKIILRHQTGAYHDMTAQDNAQFHQNFVEKVERIRSEVEAEKNQSAKNGNSPKPSEAQPFFQKDPNSKSPR